MRCIFKLREKANKKEKITMTVLTNMLSFQFFTQQAFNIFFWIEKVLKLFSKDVKLYTFQKKKVSFFGRMNLLYAL